MRNVETGRRDCNRILPLLLAIPILFVSQGALAQARCGSLEMVAEQIAAELIPVPFGRFGPRGDLLGAGASMQLTESPADIFKRCMDEALEPVPEEEPLSPVDDPRSYPGGSARDDEEEGGILGFIAAIFGDPHLVTLDRRAYDFQGAGDYVLLQYPSAGVEVQARFARLVGNPAATFTRSVAVRVGDRVVSLFEGGPGDATPVVIDGRPVPFLNSGTYRDADLHVQRFRQWYLVRFSNGLAVATVGGATVNVRIPEAWSGRVSGLLGNRDGDAGNDIALRDGTLIDPGDVDAMYGPFLDGWLTDRGDTLFSLPFDVETFGPIRPESIVTLDSLPDDAVTRATDVCGRAGLSAGPTLEGCIFDVALTGDESWANPETMAISDLGQTSASEDLGPIRLDARNELPAASTDRRWRWSVTSASNDRLFLRGTGLQATDSAIASACTVRWGLIDADGAETASGSLCIDEPNLSVEGVVALEVYVPAGIEGGFVLGLVQKGAQNQIELESTLRLDGELRSPGQIDAYALTVEPGTRLLLMDPDDGNACGVTWSILVGDEALFRGASCLDTDPIAIREGGVATVVVDAGTSTGTYSLEIVRVPESSNLELELGQSLDASIATPGEVIRYRFNATEGEQVVLADPSEANKTCQIFWRILSAGDADSAPVFDGSTCFDTDPITLPSSGPYILEVDGKQAATGAAFLTVYSVPEPRIENLRFGQALDGSVRRPGERVRFRFDGSAGETLRLSDPDNVNRNCNIVWRVTGPDADTNGQQALLFEGPVCFDSNAIELTATGAHVLEIDGKSAVIGEVAVQVDRD
ncbi:MAG: VWD domain-containing protein [Pseudomonadota bacterium]